jgi:hypothetical protein
MNTLYNQMVDAIEACYLNKTGSPLLYEKMVKAINACYEIDEGQQIEGESERLEYYAQIAQDLDLERKVIRIRNRAEKRCRRLMLELR